MNQREKFEASREPRTDLGFRRERYNNPVVQKCWETWQAAIAAQEPKEVPWWLQDKIVAYASSHEGKANCVISKAQFDSALGKNRVEYDVPLGRLDTVQEPKQAMTDAEIERISEDHIGAYGIKPIEFARAIESASSPNKELVKALQGALAVIDDYLAYDHNGDPWTEDARTMGEMDINDYQHDGRLDAARAALHAAGVEVA